MPLTPAEPALMETIGGDRGQLFRRQKTVTERLKTQVSCKLDRSSKLGRRQIRVSGYKEI